VATSTKYLLIGSIEAYSGKSGTILGIAHQLQEKGFLVGYSKFLGTCLQQTPNGIIEEDVQFISQSLALPKSQIGLPLVNLDEKTIQQRLTEADNQDYSQLLADYIQKIHGEIILLEGGGTLWEGSLFNLSLKTVAETLDISVLIVIRYTNFLCIESLLKVKQKFGDRLLGVIISDLPVAEVEEIEAVVKPYLENHGVAVLAMLPKSSLLRSISVREIRQKLGAKVLSRPDRLDLMVESLTIGAMNVNAALEYFRQGRNMAVITGGDRTDLQLAALETSTNCLILTGNMPPDPLILSRAEDLEIPILSVHLDTLSTVEIVDQAFGKVRVQEQIKVERICKLMDEHFDLERLLEKLAIVKEN
jgi:BioD-like phosphotransacetylase family protein